uniref:Uncharacterized protein n=1 Tax=Aegilops tauschii subsp. strangulata TaxID=200361 RepID=A0A453DYE7_AEGTS
MIENLEIQSCAGNNKLFFACTGIITVNTPKTTSFLTSLSLVRSIDDNSKIFHD